MRAIPTVWFTASLMAWGLTACSEPSPSDTGSDTNETTSTSGSPSGNPTAGSTGNGGSGGGGATGTGAGPADFEGTTRVDTGSGTAMPGSADVAISPDGAIYVSWVVEQSGGRDAFVARSTDGGKTFGPSIQLDDAAAVPLVSMARHPYVTADAKRVAVVFNDDAGTIFLYLANAGETLSFDGPTIVGGDITTVFRDFPKPIFLDDGSLVIAWQGYPASGARIFLSPEKSGFATEDASGGAPGVPCECCPLDIVQSATGDLMVAFRNNDSNVREMWLADAPEGGDFSKWNPISSSEGTINACPMQGPRLGKIGAGDHVAVWSARGEKDTGAVHVAFSTDGSTWSGGVPIPGFMADEPTLAVSGSGRVFVSGVTGSKSSSLVKSDDGGKTFGPPEKLAAPDGDLTTPQAEGGAGAAALAAVSSAGTVWFRRME